MLMYVSLTFSVTGILRRGGLVCAERIGRGFSEEIGADVLRRGMTEEIHHRKQYVLSGAIAHVAERASGMHGRKGLT